MDLSNTGIRHCDLADNKEASNDVKQATTQYGDSGFARMTTQTAELLRLRGDLVARTA
jgi:hypothetical protein